MTQTRLSLLARLVADSLCSDSVYWCIKLECVYQLGAYMYIMYWL